MLFWFNWNQRFYDHINRKWTIQKATLPDDSQEQILTGRVDCGQTKLWLNCYKICTFHILPHNTNLSAQYTHNQCHSCFPSTHSIFYSTGWYTSDLATGELLARGRTGESVGQEALRIHRHAFTVCFKNIQTDWSYECTGSTVNVFWSGVTIPDVYEASLAATRSCRMQVCTELKGWDRSER